MIFHNGKLGITLKYWDRYNAIIIIIMCGYLDTFFPMWFSSFQEFGKGMEYMSTFSALVANIGLFNVIMCTSSRVLASFSTDDMAGIKKLGKMT